MGKEIEVCPYNEILFHNFKKLTVDTLSNMDKLQNNYAEWKKAEKSTNFMLHLYNILGRNAIKFMTESRLVLVISISRGVNGSIKAQESFLGGGYIYYLDCDVDFMGIYI